MTISCRQCRRSYRYVWPQRSCSDMTICPCRLLNVYWSMGQVHPFSTGRGVCVCGCRCLMYWELLDLLQCWINCRVVVDMKSLSVNAIDSPHMESASVLPELSCSVSIQCGAEAVCAASAVMHGHLQMRQSARRTRTRFCSCLLARKSQMASVSVSLKAVICSKMSIWTILLSQASMGTQACRSLVRNHRIDAKSCSPAGT